MFCWTNVHFVATLIAPVLDFVWPSLQVSEPGWFSHLHTYLLAHSEPKALGTYNLFVVKDELNDTIKEFKVTKAWSNCESCRSVDSGGANWWSLQSPQSMWIVSHRSWGVDRQLTWRGSTVNISQSTWIGDGLSSILGRGCLKNYAIPLSPCKPQGCNQSL